MRAQTALVILERSQKFAMAKFQKQKKQLKFLKKKLSELQKDSAMVNEEVDAEEIAEVVSRWTGIPVNRMLAE